MIEQAPIPQVRRYWALLRNNYCERNSFSRVSALSEDELEAKIEYGRRKHWWSGDIYEAGSYLVPDPVIEAERERDSARIRRTSCLVPPKEDLELTAAARRTDPRDWAAIQAIDTTKGKWPQTRERLRRIKASLINNYFNPRNDG